MENYTEINYEAIGEETARFQYGEGIFTIHLDGEDVVSADNDGALTFDQRSILEVDEDNQVLFVEK